MTLALGIVLGLAVLYIFFVAWARRRPRWVGYQGFWSPVIRAFTNHMQATTLWNWTFILNAGDALSPAGEKHEAVHVYQFAANPYGFPFVYLWQLVRYGYQNAPAEIAARAAESV